MNLPRPQFMTTRMSVTTLATLLFVAAFASHARADGIDVPNGDFGKPERAKHGAKIEVEGFSLVGASRALRFEGASPYEHAVALGRKAELRVDVAMPEPRKPKDVAADGWYAVVSVDVLGMTTKGKATLELAVRVAGKRAKELTATMTVDQIVVRGSKSATSERTRAMARLWVKLPSSVIAASKDKRIHVAVRVLKGKGVVVDNLRLDRFHDAPTRKLLGKANGKNGPDVLASGALGFVGLSEHLRTGFSILSVREKGPAAKAGLKAGDCVVAVNGRPLLEGSLAAGTDWFKNGHEAMLGRAIEQALEGKPPSVDVTVLRDKGPVELTLKLKGSRALANTFPFDVATEAMRDDIVSWIATHQKKDGSWPGTAIVNSSLAGLALLGTRDRKHRKAIRELANFMLRKNPDPRKVGGFSFWPIAFQGIFLCEYHLATGDKKALAWVKDTISWLPHTTHESKWGMPAFGHSPKGLPYDNKALMAPCAHLLLFESLAIKCGVKSKVWEVIAPYVMHSWSDPKEKKGHGGMGYNGSHKDKNEFWSRTGLTALALHLRGGHRRMCSAMTAFMKGRHQWMLNSHAYGEPGGALGLIGLAIVDPDAFAEVMPMWRWKFLNAWEPGYGLRYSTAHMGAPYMGEDEIMNPAYGMLFTVRNKGLVLAGGKPEAWMAPRSR